MQIIQTIQALETERHQWHGSVGFVPTMGFLHEGHLSLFQKARSAHTILVASIFVNPTQFGPHEDLARYPRNLARDLQLLEAVGVDVVFTPSASEMYPEAFMTFVEPGGVLANQGEGAARPGHFRGVATVVLKLFSLIQPHSAYFGQKDAQQVAVIQRMVKDLNLPVTIQVGSTIRENDGLAMSSRNSYLTPPQRHAATILYQALQAGRKLFESDPTTDTRLVLQAMQTVIAQEPLARLEYIELRHAETFLSLERLQAPALLLLAVSIGATRLIDNFIYRTHGSWDTGQVLYSSSETNI
ncbi:pantoate--beta-alanine ligase [Tengunoibacter tsumagoiensis]|uniref:Pantothenate synthetase n=1 Tax=Tengunoibacter tsumagoiensis TaxID=2014871 RepID=A0A402A2M4_9CHLR|nr:pantoate--beta-alanine ligase [Tengunoibacter tsumagoiensis]GCE13398.1 pantothenate synthetase [Tengunoibacter tsumagoiensis]